MEKRDKDDRPSAKFKLPTLESGEEQKLPTNLFAYAYSRRSLVLQTRLSAFFNRYGSQLFVSRLDPLKENIPHKGSILRITSEAIEVAFQEKFDELVVGTWR